MPTRSTPSVWARARPPWRAPPRHRPKASRPTTTTRARWRPLPRCHSTSATCSPPRTCRGTAAMPAWTRRAACSRGSTCPAASVGSSSLSGPRFIYYDNRTQRLYMAANAAVGLGHGLYFGAGFVWMSSSHGNVQLNGLVGFPDPEQSDLRLAIDYQLETVRYPQMGLFWQHSDRLTFGLTYRHSFTLRLAQS